MLWSSKFLNSNFVLISTWRNFFSLKKDFNKKYWKRNEVYNDSIIFCYILKSFWNRKIRLKIIKKMDWPKFLFLYKILRVCIHEYLLFARFMNSLFREIPCMEIFFYYYRLPILNKEWCYLRKLLFLKRI